MTPDILLIITAAIAVFLLSALHSAGGFVISVLKNLFGRKDRGDEDREMPGSPGFRKRTSCLKKIDTSQAEDAVFYEVTD